jgi:ABC-type polysaccharide/polyol phosphate transport system ATPase subunit
MTARPAAIELVDVSKRFRLYHEKYSSLKERAIHFGRMPFEEFWALKNMSLEIAEGETVGLLGHNGSGKSTLLKCIAAILQPTTGRIVVRGQLAAMLELGAGFQSDLSGRDNIFLNATLLGMPRREIERRFDDIVAFAELDQFIDNQVKYYSSGMYARLGFAVAVNVEPDVLLIDEVLAVGDENFQRKCLERIKHFQAEGRTIVLVTHSPDLVRRICDRCYVLDRGAVAGEGPPGEAIRIFRDTLLAAGDALAASLATEDEAVVDGQSSQERKRNFRVKIRSINVEHTGSGTRSYLLPSEWLRVTVSFDGVTPVEDAVMGIAIYDVDGELVYGSNTEVEGLEVGPLFGPGQVSFEFDSVPLLDGSYDISVGIHSPDGGTVYDWWEQKARFEVMNPGRQDGKVSLPLRIKVAKSSVEEQATR